MTVKTITTEVEVEVDLSEFDDDEIAEEYEARALGDFDLNENIEELFYAFKLGKDDRAMEIARQIAQEHTGRIL